MHPDFLLQVNQITACQAEQAEHLLYNPRVYQNSLESLWQNATPYSTTDDK